MNFTMMHGFTNVKGTTSFFILAVIFINYACAYMK